MLNSTILAFTLLFGVIIAPSAIASSPGPNRLAPTMTTKNCGGGIYVHTAIPPQGFDPLTATNAELMQNHLPSKPAGGPALKAWEKSVTQKHAQGACPIGIGYPGSAQHRTSHMSSDGISSTSPAASDSPNWAGYQGYEADDVDVDGFDSVEALGDFVVPVGGSGGGPDLTGVYRSSSWVGVGQGQSDRFPLVQGGTESDYVGSVGFTYYLWWEVFPQLSQQKISVDVDPGDQIQVQAYVGDTPHGVSSATVEVQDLTNGVGEGTWYDYQSGTFYPDGYMEWILERSGGSGEYPLLSDAPTSFCRSVRIHSRGRSVFARRDDRLSHQHVELYGRAGSGTRGTRRIYGLLPARRHRL